MVRLVSVLLLLVLPCLAGPVPAPRDVDVTAPDGVKLKATYYAAAKPGPGVLLLHMCNTDRKSWEPLATQLAEAGFHTLALDYRGYGASGGERFQDDPQKQQAIVTEKWPGDVDAAYAFLASQKGVDKTRMGAAGGSCGVNQAVQVARRHPEVKALALLAGGANREGLDFLYQNRWLPLFVAAASDDQFGGDFPLQMQWLTDLNGNPRNQVASYATGGHGTEIFPVHPDLPKRITAWYVDTLIKRPAEPKAAVAAKPTPAGEFWTALNQPGGSERAVELFREARKRDAQAFLFPEGVMNLLGYERLQAGQAQEAIALFKLNIEAYPNSFNAYDSLGDGYLAAGQNELALQAAQRSLEMLAADKTTGNEEFKKAVRASAEQKVQQLTAAKKE